MTATTTRTTAATVADALTVTRSRRGLFAFAAAAAAIVAAPAAIPAAAAPKAHGRVKAAAALPALPALDPKAYAGNPALNEFNLLINRLIRNLDAWQAAIAAPVAAARRASVAALGESVAADLAKIVSHEKTFLAGGSLTWAAGAAKLKEQGVDAELQRIMPGQTLDSAVTLLQASLGPTLGGFATYYNGAKAEIAAEITLIRRQAAEIRKTGTVTVRAARVRGAQLRRVSAQARTCIPTLCILFYLATVGIFLSVQTVMNCMVYTGNSAILVCLKRVSGCSAAVLANITLCLTRARC